MINNIITLSTQLKWSEIGSGHQHYHFTHLVIRNIKSIKQWSPISLCCLYNKHQYHMCCLCNQFRVIKYTVRHRSQTLVGLAWSKNKTKQNKKKGGLKIFDSCKGGLEKNDHKFSSKNWVYMLKLRGLTSNFYGKKGKGAWIFWHQAPLKSDCERSLIPKFKKKICDISLVKTLRKILFVFVFFPRKWAVRSVNFACVCAF